MDPILNKEVGAPIPDEPEENDVSVPEEENSEDVEKLEASGVNKEIEDAILACFNHYRKEEESMRTTMIGFWTKLENYWNGIQDLFWDYSASDWRRPTSDDLTQLSEDNPELYDKIINIYRAYGESIIAALSIKLPNVTFYPDDADVIEDVETAKGYTKISELVVKHNKGVLLFIKALFILFNQGVIAAYIYNRESPENGTIKVPDYGDDITLNHHSATCPLCQGVIEQETTHGDAQHNIMDVANCPNCGATVEPDFNTEQETLPQIVGYSDLPKSKTHIEVFGPKYAQFPFYARKQADIPYLQLRFEQHVALLRDFYGDNDEILSKIPATSSGNAIGAIDRLARAYYNSTSDVNSLVTVTCQWLRPWAFDILEKELADKCKKQYPKGCYAVIINDSILVDAREESLDEKWEISEDPLSTYLHADPIGKSLAPIQEISTEINDLALETFRHSIPETFADPRVLDFEKYEKEESRPGMVYPAKAAQGQNLADGFHSLKTATLTEEIQGYDQNIQGKAQLASGAFPSIFGGANTSGSKTAQEYSESRAMALQRLQNHWVKLKFWWAGVVSKSAVCYASNMISDEKIVQKSSQSEVGFVNSWIKQIELNGKIGNVEPDADEELPMSFAQIKGTILDLVTLNNDYVNEGLFNSNNIPLLSRAIGLRDLHIPGQNDRDKQYAEISDLIKGIPRAVNPLVDDHLVHIQSLKYWLTSTAGLNCEKYNSQGYQLAMQHLQEHQLALQAATDAKTETPEGQPPDSAIASVRN
jgi:hypothetical protein